LNTVAYGLSASFSGAKRSSKIATRCRVPALAVCGLPGHYDVAASAKIDFTLARG